MKKLFLVCLSTISLFPLQVYAQHLLTADTLLIKATTVSAKRPAVFTSIYLVPGNYCPRLSFGVNHVQNVRAYRIEAGNDPDDLELLGRVLPKNNSVLPCRFAFPLPGADFDYKYYRIVQETMSYEWTGSQLITHTPDPGSYSNSRKTEELLIPAIIVKR